MAPPTVSPVSELKRPSSPDIKAEEMVTVRKSSSAGNAGHFSEVADLDETLLQRDDSLPDVTLVPIATALRHPTGDAVFEENYSDDADSLDENISTVTVNFQADREAAKTPVDVSQTNRLSGEVCAIWPISLFAYCSLFAYLSVCQFICLPIHLFVCLSVHLAVCMLANLSGWLAVCLFVSLFVCQSVRQSVYLFCFSIRLSVFMPVCQFICLVVCNSGCLSACQSVYLSLCLFVRHPARVSCPCR